MRTALRFHEAAERELAQALDYYQAVAVAFANELSRCLDLIGEHPFAGRQVAPNVRVVVMSGLPYSIVHKLCESEIQIIAIAHQARRPGYWLERSE